MSEDYREVKLLSHPAHVANALRKALRGASEVNFNEGSEAAAIYLVDEIGHILVRLDHTSAVQAANTIRSVNEAQSAHS